MMVAERVRIKTPRIHAFDLLRGFFIVVIVIDHLWRFPSLWTFMTGQALLWMTAAEGFIMISGFMIGYIRGLRSLHKPFTEIAITLLKRAGVLYIWMIIVSLIYTALSWYGSSSVYVPGVAEKAVGWPQAIIDIVTMQTPATWIHFLKLYTVFLVGAVGFVWLLRRHKPWLTFGLTFGLYLIGLWINSELLKWQFLFFMAGLAGFYLEELKILWHKLTKNNQRLFLIAVYACTLLTVIASAIVSFFPASLSPDLVKLNHELFFQDSFGMARVMVSLLWFSALIILFYQLTPLLQKITHRQLEFIGTHSLTAYIVHGMALYLINLTVWPDNVLTNTLLGALAVVLVWALIRLPLTRNLIPR